MENFIASLACSVRAARKPLALMIGTAALAVAPVHGFAAQNNPAAAASPQTSFVNFPAPASTPATTPPSAQATLAPSYKPGDPLYMGAPKVQAADQPLPAPESQAAVPPDVLRDEMLSLNVRMGTCQNNASCSTLTQLRLLTDASDAMHESLLRINDECTVLDTTTCLSRQYSELQQWSALNGQMEAMLQSVAAAAGNAQNLLVSQGTPPAGSELNNMEPAAGN